MVQSNPPAISAANALTTAASAAKIEVLFAELDSTNHRFVTDVVAHALHDLATTLHKVALVIDSLESELSSVIAGAESHAVHVEPVLLQLRDRLRASKWCHKGQRSSEIFEVSVDGVKIPAPVETRGSAGYGTSPRPTVVAKLPPLTEIGASCVTSKNFAATLRTFATLFDKDVQEVLDSLLVDLNRERRRALGKLVWAAFVPSIAPECQALFDKYIHYAALSQLAELPRIEPAQVKVSDWLFKIEGQPVIRLGMDYVLQFRRDVLAAARCYQEEHGLQPVPYTVHRGLQECIEFYVLEFVRRTPSGFRYVADHLTKLDAVRTNLVDEHGFCSHCAGELLEEFVRTQNFLRA